MEKKDQLDEIARRICSDERNPLRGNGSCVPGEGNPDADIFFAGEAPGYHESQHGRPFVGQAGRLLDKLLDSIGLKRAEVFIGNVLHWRPPGNRDPLPEEVELEMPYLLEQIEVVDPEIVVSLGRFAMSVFLPDGKISQVHGHARRLKNGRLFFPLYHPAAGLRSRKILEQLENDFENLGKLYRLEKGEYEQAAVDVKIQKQEPERKQGSLFDP